MNRKQLKEMLKPMVKECIKEALLEDGLLSGIIAEVANGIASSSLITERREAAPNMDGDFEREIVLEEQRRKTEQVRQQRIKRLNESASKTFGGVNVFEGTTPMTSRGASTPEPGQGPLSGVDPSDPGVDIRGLAALAGGNWKKMMEGK